MGCPQGLPRGRSPSAIPFRVRPARCRVSTEQSQLVQLPKAGSSDDCGQVQVLCAEIGRRQVAVQFFSARRLVHVPLAALRPSDYPVDFEVETRPALKPELRIAVKRGFSEMLASLRSAWLLRFMCRGAGFVIGESSMVMRATRHQEPGQGRRRLRRLSRRRPKLKLFRVSAGADVT